MSVAALLLSACGNTDNDLPPEEEPAPPPPPPVELVTSCFKTPTTVGLGFRTATRQGVTNASGCFETEANEAITLTTGGVTLGVIPAPTPAITVLQLADTPAGRSGRVRYMEMLGGDQDTHRLVFSSSIQARWNSWQQVDFEAADLAAEFAVIQADAVSADGNAHRIPSEQFAQDRIARTVSCLYSGVHTGNHRGEIADRDLFGTNNISGSIGMAVMPLGAIVGAATYFRPSASEAVLFAYLNSDADLPIEQRQFESVGPTINFAGRFANYRTVNGEWFLNSAPNAEPGTFNMALRGAAHLALWRFTAASAEPQRLLVSTLVFADDSAEMFIAGPAGVEVETLQGRWTGTELIMEQGKFYSFRGTAMYDFERGLHIPGVLSGTTSVSLDLETCST